MYFLTPSFSALETSYVRGVQGHPALLPCDVTPPEEGELVYLVLWYRGDEGEPLYSYDSRQVGHKVGLGRISGLGQEVPDKSSRIFGIWQDNAGLSGDMR